VAEFKVKGDPGLFELYEAVGRTLLYLLLYKPYVFVAPLYFSILAFFDWKYREIDAWIILAGIPACVLAHVFAFTKVAMITTNYVIALAINAVLGLTIGFISYLLCRAKLLGDADVFIYSYAFLMNPYYVVFLKFGLPAGFVVFVLSAVYVGFQLLRNVYVNIKRFKVFRRLVDEEPFWKNLTYFIIGRTMSAEEFKQSRYFFLLKDSSEGRILVNVLDEPLSGSEREIRGDHVIASFGLPAASAIFLGNLLLFGFSVFFPIFYIL